MTEAQKTVLNLTSAALFGSPVAIPSETDWRAVYDELKAQELVSLLYPLTADLNIPDAIQKEWSEDRDKYLLNNAKNIGGHFAVQKLMDESGIPCVILKGLASASYYPDYLLRAFGDVDFLVPKTEYKKAASILERSGYRLVRSIDKDKKYTKNGFNYELHREIAEFPDASAKAIIAERFSDVFDSARTFTHNGRSCKIPSDRHHAHILMVHSAEHLWSSGLGLRHLSDWAVFVGKTPDSFFEEDMQPILKKLKLWQFCGIMTNLCSEHLGLRKCEWAQKAAPELSDSLIEDLFTSGAFGHNYAEPSAEKPHLAFFSILSKRTKTLFPRASKNPLLLPACYVFVTGRYLLRMAAGRRSTSMARAMLNNRSNRQGVSDEWHLYE